MTIQLAIRDVAQRTGLTAGTIRMWEQRYGFPAPERTQSGYRRYSEYDVQALRKVVALRHRGLSVPAAIARAGDSVITSDRPSIYAAVAGTEPGLHPHQLGKPTLAALSRAIEHEALARAAAPVVFAAFQREAFYRQVEARYRRLAGRADAAAVFADFTIVGHPAGGPAELPISAADPLGSEWAVIVDAPGFAACLLAWELPSEHEPGGPHDHERRFEAVWTIDPRVTRRAAEAAARLAGAIDPICGTRLDALLGDRPLALEEPPPGLTALTNRMIAELDGLQ